LVCDGDGEENMKDDITFYCVFRFRREV